MKSVRKLPPRRENDGYRVGVNRENSPIFEFTEDPENLIQYALKYAHILQSIRYLTGFDKDQDKSIWIGDMGCGSGELYLWLKTAKLAKNTTITYHGIDIDSEKIQRASEYFDFLVARFYCIDIKEFLLDCVFIKIKYNVIVLADVLEHVELNESIDILKYAKDAAKYLIVTWPAPSRRKNEWHINEKDTDFVLNLFINMGFKVLFSGSTKVYLKDENFSFISDVILRHYYGMNNVIDKIEKRVDNYFVLEC